MSPFGVLEVPHERGPNNHCVRHLAAAEPAAGLAIPKPQRHRQATGLAFTR